jgi:hypothetical protein
MTPEQEKKDLYSIVFIISMLKRKRTNEQMSNKLFAYFPRFEKEKKKFFFYFPIALFHNI